jgi:hypothetical protein
VCQPSQFRSNLHPASGGLHPARSQQAMHHRMVGSRLSRGQCHGSFIKTTLVTTLGLRIKILYKESACCGAAPTFWFCRWRGADGPNTMDAVPFSLVKPETCEDDDPRRIKRFPGNSDEPSTRRLRSGRPPEWRSAGCWASAIRSASREIVFEAPVHASPFHAHPFTQRHQIKPVI